MEVLLEVEELVVVEPVELQLVQQGLLTLVVVVEVPVVQVVPVVQE